MPGFEGLYDVSSHGRVWSHVRTVRTRNRYGSMMRTTQAKMLSLYQDTRRRRSVCLCKDGVNINPFVHRVMMAAFVGPCPDGMEVAHYDGDPSNNHLSNLRYDTRKGNHYDKRRHGTHQSGERNPGAKINQRVADEIRSLKGQIASREAAFRYDLEKTTILDIWSGKRWAAHA